MSRSIMPETTPHFWQNWDLTRERYVAWWRHEGLILHVLARRDETPQSVSNPQAPFYHLMGGLDTTITFETEMELQDAWLNPRRRAHAALSKAEASRLPLFNHVTNPSIAPEYNLLKLDITAGCQVTKRFGIELEYTPSIYGENTSKGATSAVAITYVW